ncbi:hypothetical protein HQ576_05730 [bacterium]|nr:hypothetical protein [bacterium]
MRRLALIPIVLASVAHAAAFDVVGRWRGVHTARGFGFQQIVLVKKEAQGRSAKALTWFGLTEAQAKAATRGQHPSLPKEQFACAFVQYYDVAFKDDVLAFSGTRVKGLFRTPHDFKPFTFSGVIQPPGILVARAPGEKGEKTMVTLWKQGVLDKPLPLTLGKRVVHRLACLHTKEYHYSCYIPGSYDPARPTPVLMNFSPGGNGNPLHAKMADALGWIMVGLTESKNGPVQPSCENRDAVLLDLRRRFNVHPRRLYFSGFSGGARMASWAGYTYPGWCAGMICIAAGHLQYPPPVRQAVFFIAGKTDFNNAEVTRRHAEALKAGRQTKLIIHPGGHTWGRAEDHEAALRWLDGLQGGKKKT